MKKKSLSVLALTTILSLISCSPSKDTSLEFYEDLYTSDNLEAFSDELRLTTKALYGYNKKSEQGYNSWYYLAGDISSNTLLEYSTKKEAWACNKVEIKDELMSSRGKGAIRKYISRIEGNGFIYGNFKSLDEKSSSFNVKIYQNSTLLLDFDEEKGNVIGQYFEIPVRLNVGDEIFFIVTGSDAKVLFNPVITLENSMESTMYHLNDFGKQYGDVFPYYDLDDKKLKMMYLWTDDCLANNGNNYSWGLDISSNMLKFKTYQEGDNYDKYYEHYNEYFLQRIYDVNRFIDRSKYNFGIRDNFLYRDENRMYMIAGCYRYFDYRWDSDLMIYTSDDPMGLSWSKPGVKVATYTGTHQDGTGHLPECPSLLKIGNRWYSFVSVSHVTTHQIGALQYWIGDENKDFMDVNWEDKEISFLDGEDLCAARPTHVGDKTYMWGWITASHDGVPLKPWAGYLNLPREIVQREDGSLGGRMDPALEKVMNYGNIYTLNSDNYHVSNGAAKYIEKDNLLDVTGAMNDIKLVDNQTRNFITLDVDMKQSNKVSLRFDQGDKHYLCSIEKENGDVFMKIESPKETTHKVNSKLKIRYPSADGKYKIKLVVDNGIMEFFVNDDNALSASLAMDESPYNISLLSDYTCSFSNVHINKLRSYADCEF